MRKDSPMEQRIFSEKTGLWYTLGEHDLYYPEIALNDRSESYGHYGKLRRTYLEKHHPAIFNHMILEDSLHQHLVDVDKRTTAQVEQIIQHMAKAEHCDEALKMADPLKWVGLMNNYKSCAEEIVLPQLIYV